VVWISVDIDFADAVRPGIETFDVTSETSMTGTVVLVTCRRSMSGASMT
jgi:hypothetical protein